MEDNPEKLPPVGRKNDWFTSVGMVVFIALVILICMYINERGKQQRGYLGVWADTNSHGPGVRVHRLLQGGGAKTAGMKVGDVILSIDGFAVSTRYDVHNLMNETVPGQSVHLQIWRDDQEQSMHVKLIDYQTMRDVTKHLPTSEGAQ